MEDLDLDNIDDGIRDINVPVSQLLLDEANFRIDEVDSQEDALFEVLKQQREGTKILNLAKDIVKRGRLAPGDRLLVIPDDGQMDDAEHAGEYYVVMEGNRRITALKLLQNPRLVPAEFPKLYQEFEALSRVAPKRLLAGVPCSLLPDRASALDWVEIKHSTDLDGIGLEKWDARATARFAERQGQYRRWRIALKRLGAANVDTSGIEHAIARKTTAVDRVLGSRDIREILGLIFRDSDGTLDFENGDETAGVNLLLKLFEAMADSEFKTAKVHSLAARTNFVRGFQQYAVKTTPRSEPQDDQNRDGDHDAGGQDDPTRHGKNKVEDEPKGQEESPADDRDKEPPAQKRIAKVPGGKHPLRSRKFLAPKGLHETFHVKDAALNDLYRELRDLRVKGFEKTAGVLTRVFLEMSCDAYLVHRNIALPTYFAKRNVTSWPDAKLREKVKAVVEDLDPTGQNTDLTYVRKALGGDDWLHSIGTLHEFVHNRLSSITEQEVMTIWDRYHPFFQCLHDRIWND